MSPPPSRQAEHARRRREAGDRRVAAWITPEDQAILARHRPMTGSDEETVRQALRALDQLPEVVF